MAMFQDESTDDETCYLQLGERLSINRGACNGRMNGKEMKQLFNQRQKHILNDQSSSSSSLDMQQEPSLPGPSRVRSLQNKKRQNGDKPIDQLTNPKRSCLEDECQRSPEESGCRKKKTKGDIPHSRRIMDFSAEVPTSPTQSLFPDKTYEDHASQIRDNASQMKAHFIVGHSDPDSEIEIWQIKKTIENKDERQQENPPSQGVQFIDSASEEDSKIVPTGALKGGRQSPDPTCTKKVMGRKVKRVLDSDNSDSEDWPSRGYHPVIFSSSDSEDSKPIARLMKKSSDIVSKKSANLSFSSGDSGHNHGHHRAGGSNSFYENRIVTPPTPPRSNYRTRSPSYKSYKSRVANRANGQTVFTSIEHNVEEHLVMSERHTRPPLTLPNPRRTLRSARIADARAPSRPGTNSAQQRNSDNVASGGNSLTRDCKTPPVARSFTSAFRNFEVPPVSPPNVVHVAVSRGSSRRNMPDGSSRRALGRSRPHRTMPNLAAAFPDIFDANDSSENEFFTANSYSDNESNTEPVPSLGDLGYRAISMPAERPVNVSSEDEISVVYTNCPDPIPWPSRRGTPRTLGRRFNRGSRRHLSRPHDVSHSPDPVEQVRQMEEDERFARMLQAQFDAEAETAIRPVQRPNVSPNPCQMNMQGYTSSDDDSSNPDLREFVPRSRRSAFSQLAVRTVRPPPAFLLNPDMFVRRNFNPRTALPARQYRIPDHWREEWNPGNLSSFSSLLAIETEDSYEAFLGLAEMNGDVTRGLQKSQINRLPTRKYATTNGASTSGAELPHKRADLNKECQVCLNDYVTGDVLRILPCFHEFHTPCIDPWLKINYTCPVCRVVVNLH